ncbi:MAG: endonuclease/exonuclease/phosphatase family protein [Bacteroidales bacterium]
MKSNILILTFFTLFIFTGHAQKNEQQEKTVRVLTINILHGATLHGDFDLEKLASIIREVDPDLVALQEVDVRTNRARHYDLATEFGHRTKMTPFFGKALDFDGGYYGVGVLTKRSVISSRNIPLPYTPGTEPRTALQVILELESGDTITFTSTHLDPLSDNTNRMMQVEKINHFSADFDYPAILAGDLNDTPGSHIISILKKHWTVAAGENPHPTYPSDYPRKKIDYILFQPSGAWKILKTEVICDSVASDHCALLSVLQLN